MADGGRIRPGADLCPDSDPRIDDIVDMSLNSRLRELNARNGRAAHGVGAPAVRGALQDPSTSEAVVGTLPGSIRPEDFRQASERIGAPVVDVALPRALDESATP